FGNTVPDGKLFGGIRCVPYVDGNEQLPEISSQDLGNPVDYPYQSPPGGGYTFSNVVFRQAPDGWVSDYQMSWDADSFPGERVCSVQVFDKTGTVIAHENGQREMLEDQASGRELTSSAEPASFEGSCGDRVDTPVSYVISDPTAV